MEKVTRRVIKRWSGMSLCFVFRLHLQLNIHPIEYSHDHADLGAALNGFSLNETGTLSGAIEKTGQTVDATYMSTTKLVRALVFIFTANVNLILFQLQDLEQNWAEPLHEYSQFAVIIKKLLAYRHQKHVQYEMTQDALENKREQLEDLEKSEREARRLEEALGKGRVSGLSSSLVNPSREESEDAPELVTTNSLPPHPGPNPTRRRTKPPGMGLLNALSYTLHGMMDVDPETARRNGITKTRENISQVRSLVCMLVHPLHSILGSLKTLCILPHRILNIRAPLYKQIWIDFNGKRLLIYERC